MTIKYVCMIPNDFMDKMYYVICFYVVRVSKKLLECFITFIPKQIATTNLLFSLDCSGQATRSKPVKFILKKKKKLFYSNPFECVIINRTRVYFNWCALIFKTSRHFLFCLGVQFYQRMAGRSIYIRTLYSCTVSVTQIGGMHRIQS